VGCVAGGAPAPDAPPKQRRRRVPDPDRPGKRRGPTDACRHRSSTPLRDDGAARRFRCIASVGSRAGLPSPMMACVGSPTSRSTAPSPRRRLVVVRRSWVGSTAWKPRPGLPSWTGAKGPRPAERHRRLRRGAAARPGPGPSADRTEGRHRGGRSGRRLRRLSETAQAAGTPGAGDRARGWPAARTLQRARKRSTSPHAS
jgi:hypothetical protein